MSFSGREELPDSTVEQQKGDLPLPLAEERSVGEMDEADLPRADTTSSTSFARFSSLAMHCVISASRIRVSSSIWCMRALFAWNRSG